MTQKTLTIKPIQALQDNYIWLITHIQTNQCIVIDPGEATPILNYLNKHQVELLAVLVTHKHADHTSGILTLQKYFPYLEIYSSISELRLPRMTILRDGDVLSLLNNEFKCFVYAVPGHTLEHIAYYAPNINGFSAIFSGDTLFSGGCGRLFEGTPYMLYSSLLKLRKLPPLTRLYCGHEYTVSNLKFARWLEPGNLDIQSALEKAQFCIANQGQTLPSTLAVECLTNPFLRCDQLPFMQAMKKKFNLPDTYTSLDLFTHLRYQKDLWGA